MFDKSQLNVQAQSVIIQQKSCPGCMSPYLLVVIFSYIKLASVLVYGCELFVLINLTGSSDSPQPLKTIKPWLLLPQTCPVQHALLTPFTVCLFVLWFLSPHTKTTGCKPNHLGHWKFTFSRMWPTHGPCSCPGEGMYTTYILFC